MTKNFSALEDTGTAVKANNKVPGNGCASQIFWERGIHSARSLTTDRCCGIHSSLPSVPASGLPKIGSSLFSVEWSRSFAPTQGPEQPGESPEGTIENSPAFQFNTGLASPEGIESRMDDRKHSANRRRLFRPSGACASFARAPTVETVAYFRSPLRGCPGPDRESAHSGTSTISSETELGMGSLCFFRL